MKTLRVEASTPYDIHISHRLLETTALNVCCRRLNKRLVMITDSNLLPTLGAQVQQSLQKQGLPIEVLSFPAGERHKTRETKHMLENTLLLKQYGRDTCLLALGGGVVSDLVGFLGATYCRGLPVIYLPTTLLAMVDASIGGKTAVNTPYGKNMIGTFTQPELVLIDTQTLKTLPPREWRNGVVEMIKHSLIANASVFDVLYQNVDAIKQHDSDCLLDMIYASCLIKKDIVEQDEQEHGIRKLLNFGHTIGHAIELRENHEIGHGEAVAIGMLVEGYLSVLHGYMEAATLVRIEKILRLYGLPLQTIAFQDRVAFEKVLMMDKKAVLNVPSFVLLEDIGHPHIHHNQYSMPVNPTHLTRALDWAATYFRPVDVTC